MTESPRTGKALIGGEWVESQSGERYEVIYPGDQSVIGSVPVCNGRDVKLAVAAAQEGMAALREMSLLSRLELLHAAQEIAKEYDKESSLLVCLESGKPISQAEAEGGTISGYGWSNFHVAVNNVKSLRGQTLPNVTEATNHKRLSYSYAPLGVIANLSDFSYPCEMPNCTVPYALALGCPVILKPSVHAPFSSILLAEILTKAGFPAGSVSVLTGPDAALSDALAESPGVAGLHFFGHEDDALRLSSKAGFKKRLFAIVSNNALVVMDDANLEAAVAAAVGGVSGHNGCSPISTRRILVHQDVYARFKEMFLAAMQGLNMADARDPKADVAALRDQTVLDTALAHLDDAKLKGAKVLLGGNNPDGWYLEPTVLEDVTSDMLVAQEATPGPIAPLMTFKDRDEAVSLANSTRFGFQMGVFTSGLSNAYYLSENIQAGSVYVNEATNCWDEMAPFGGVKQSGMGRMLSDWIFMEMAQIKMTLIDLDKVAG
jgi:succinate-semialdehyde dehydrogenase/glutarate-semialdehyde dehydrogenase